MTPTERAKRSDALYYETVSVTRRVLCDMIANREADLEDARAKSEHMRLKALAVTGELQEENERLKADNAKLRELAAQMAEALRVGGEWCDRECIVVFGCDGMDECPIAKELRELGVEVG